jgi:uncharacterized membrane protein
MKDIYLLLILSLLISYTPFVTKILLQSFTFDEILCMRYLFIQIPLLFYFIYKMFFTKNKLSFLKKINYKHICYVNIMLFTYIVGAGIHYTLLNKSQVSNITPLLSPLIIIFTLMIGYVYFKETLQKNEVMGVFMIIIGIYVIKSTFCKNLFN